MCLCRDCPSFLRALQVDLLMALFWTVLLLGTHDRYLKLTDQDQSKVWKTPPEIRLFHTLTWPIFGAYLLSIIFLGVGEGRESATQYGSGLLLRILLQCVAIPVLLHPMIGLLRTPPPGLSATAMMALLLLLITILFGTLVGNFLVYRHYTGMGGAIRLPGCPMNTVNLDVEATSGPRPPPSYSNLDYPRQNQFVRPPSQAESPSAPANPDADHPPPK